MLNFQSFELFQSLNPVRHAPAGRHLFNAMVPDWNLGVEEEIASKQGARLGQPRDAIARTMRPGKIEQLHFNITNEQGHLILEGQRGRSNDHIAYLRISKRTSPILLSLLCRGAAAQDEPESRTLEVDVGNHLQHHEGDRPERTAQRWHEVDRQ